MPKIVLPEIRHLSKKEKGKIYRKRWRDKNPTYHRNVNIAAKHEEKRKERWINLRRAVITYLGGKCSSPDCKWLNSKNEFGCDDENILQIDHVKGGGTKERKQIGYPEIYRKVVLDTEGAYQLLCANCNWLKYKNKIIR